MPAAAALRFLDLSNALPVGLYVQISTHDPLRSAVYHRPCLFPSAGCWSWCGVLTPERPFPACQSGPSLGRNDVSASSQLIWPAERQPAEGAREVLTMGREVVVMERESLAKW